MLIKAQAVNQAGISRVVSLRCPGCGQIGTFDAFSNVQDIQTSLHALGQRRCPNPECCTHVFFVWSLQQNRLAVAYPAERIGFDATDVPNEVKARLRKQ